MKDVAIIAYQQSDCVRDAGAQNEVELIIVADGPGQVSHVQFKNVIVLETGINFGVPVINSSSSKGWRLSHAAIRSQKAKGSS